MEGAGEAAAKVMVASLAAAREELKEGEQTEVARAEVTVVAVVWVAVERAGALMAVLQVEAGVMGAAGVVGVGREAWEVASWCRERVGAAKAAETTARVAAGEAVAAEEASTSAA